MSDEELNVMRTYFQVIRGIEVCLSEHLIMPALVLLYGVIDAASWLAAEGGEENDGVRFQAWVDTWMLRKYPLACTAEELYSARCAILHTLTPDSRLTKNKGVRRVAYAWGTAKAEDNEAAIQITGYSGLVTLQIESILSSFRQGFADWLESLENDPASKAAFAKKASQAFSTMDVSTLKDFLAGSVSSPTSA